MLFHKKNKEDKIWKPVRTIGYIFAYFIFTTILYIILKLLKEIPSDWGYFHIMTITLIISAIGIILKRILR